MIPYRDRNPSGTVPLVTGGLIVLNVLVFLVEVSQGARLGSFVAQYGLCPALATKLLRVGPGRIDGASLIVRSFFTHMFLHGGWMHLIGNMWYLWIFGDNVEDRMGHVKFLVFYLICGLGAASLHVGLRPDSVVPMVGASGAIAGVLGAYMLAFPRAQVDTLVPLPLLFTIIPLPAFVLLGVWFLLQFWSGWQSMRFPGTGGVAWWAHVGGFVLGMVLLFVFQKPAPRRRAYGYYRR